MYFFRNIPHDVCIYERSLNVCVWFIDLFNGLSVNTIKTAKGSHFWCVINRLPQNIIHTSTCRYKFYM